MDEALNQWNVINQLLMPDIKTYQKNWDLINIKTIVTNKLNFHQQTDIARFKALQCNEVFTYSNGLISAPCGSFFGDLNRW